MDHNCILIKLPFVNILTISEPISLQPISFSIIQQFLLVLLLSCEIISFLECPLTRYETFLSKLENNLPLSAPILQ